jgi:leader peptidase (prepilin peptidase)/N-methyltransferase
MLGWILLRGRCRDCGEPISPRYPLVEAACGLALAVLAAVAIAWLT